MFEYLMIWMPLRTDSHTARMLEYGTIAVLIMGTVAAAVALVDTGLTAPFAV